MMRSVCICVGLVFAAPVVAMEAESVGIVATWNGGKVMREDYDSWRTALELEDSPEVIHEYIFVQSLAELARKRGAQNELQVMLESEISRRKILSAALRSRAVAEIVITDEEVEKLRLTYPEAFVRPRKLLLRNLYKKLGDD
ncbi:hypothetical protein, partial [Dokdonella sp.]|uniref:hypothetical protein n=1 Tax=Dokdonella sp. TaxID=2291710 RepID=UPI003C38219C